MKRTRDRHAWSKLLAWVQVARLQFHPMAFLAYSLGAVAAVPHGTSLETGVFWLGYLTMFCIELGTVLVNEVYDRDTDRLNRNRSPFTGGSGILITGRLTVPAVRRGAGMCFGTAVLAALATLLTSAVPHPAEVLAYLLVGLGLGIGYTMPPLRLSARGLGEATVGFTHSFYLIGYGYLLQNGIPFDSEVILLALPVFFSVLAAILLAGLPDLGADRRVRKKTLAVRFGPRITAELAAGSSLMSLAAVLPLALLGPLPISVIAWYVGCSGLHAMVLVAAIAGVIRRRAFNTRIDTVLQLALSHILWTVLVPLAGLW
ncbi:MAG TPA: prenyltransferase [Desulfomicrobiaceae bacterium]|nr:prenyltransferase [Desulfomicrobiaceae bacterium]